MKQFVQTIVSYDYTVMNLIQQVDFKTLFEELTDFHFVNKILSIRTLVIGVWLNVLIITDLLNPI